MTDADIIKIAEENWSSCTSNAWAFEQDDLLKFARALLAAGASEGQEPVAYLRKDEYGNSDTVDSHIYGAFPVYAHPSAELTALRKERDELMKALADCREACPIPDAGSDLEGHWAAAIGNPGDVPGFVAGSITALRERIAGMEKDAERYEWLRSLGQDWWRRAFNAGYGFPSDDSIDKFVEGKMGERDD